MASKLKQKLVNSIDTSDSAPDPKLAEKYLLSVTAGPSYDENTHKRVFVNDPNKECMFSNEFMTVKVRVRIRNYRGLPLNSPPSSKYFEDSTHKKDSYSVALSFVPKRDIKATRMVFGNDFDHPVRDRLPPGVNKAFKIVKEFVDPGLEMDAYSDTPWLLGPALSCWFKFRVGARVEGEDDYLKFPIAADDNVLQEGADGDGRTIRSQLDIPDDSEKRRKFFLDEKNRDQFVFEKGRCYQADFFNPFLDFSNFAMKLPGFSIGVLKYIDDKSHTLRYVCKDKESGQVYFVVQFKLLFGEEMQRAKEAKEEERTARSEETYGNGNERNKGAVRRGDSEKGEQNDSSQHADQNHPEQTDSPVRPVTQSNPCSTGNTKDPNIESDRSVDQILHDTKTGDMTSRKLDIFHQ